MLRSPWAIVLAYLTAFVAILLFIIVPMVAFAAEVAVVGDKPVIVPWGDFVVALMTSAVQPALIIVIGGLSSWLVKKLINVAPFLQKYISDAIVEHALTSYLDYGVNAVPGAVKGKALSFDMGRDVLNVGMQRAIDAGSPLVIKLVGSYAELAARAFRKMYLDDTATVENVLDPVLATLPLGKPASVKG